MGFLDWHPISGPIRALNGTSEDDQQSDSCLGGEGQFVDCRPNGTGETISGAYWECGDCGHVPVRREDSTCGGCGAVMEWDENNPDHQER